MFTKLHWLIYKSFKNSLKFLLLWASITFLHQECHNYVSGEYTCLSNKGFSIVDYFLTTADQLEGVKRLEVNCDEKYSGHKDAHSDH